MYEMKNMELMISFLRKRLAEMPHGSFGEKNGRMVVYITYDPADKSVDARNKKCYSVDSPNGKIWSPVISEYIATKKKLDSYLNIWNGIYRFNPRNIDYPLEKSRSTLLTDRFFSDAKEYANPTPIEHPIKYNGKILRSKNELLGVQTIEKFGLDFKIEIAVGNDPFNMLYPDITFYVPYQQRCISMEINGALNVAKYANKSLNRQSTYIDLGLMIGKDVIFLDIADPGQFYAELLETQIKTAILSGLDDIVFPHGYVNDIFDHTMDSLPSGFWSIS
ncbi:MAG: hypothetical protein IKE53_06400 [Clostridiales bacterium]|nr:hypothetical protein [Clostridiales bacterium]MBR6390289.1 hypothetical protein [Lachnospiraceae bacterium]